MAADWFASQLDWSVRDRLIGLPTKHCHGSGSMRSGQHEPALSRKRWLLRSLRVDLGHAKQAQELALELGQLSLEDHRPLSTPNLERMPLHVVEQIDQPAGRRTSALAALRVHRQACNRLAIHGTT